MWLEFVSAMPLAVTIDLITFLCLHFIIFHRLCQKFKRLILSLQKSPGYKFKLSAVVKDQGERPQQSSITLDIQVVESNKKSPSFIEVPDGPIRLKENFADFNAHIATVRAM